MGIQQDAGEILLFMYQSYTKDESIDAEKLLETTGWDGNRIDRAIKYLKDLSAIQIIHTLGNFKGVQHFIFRSLTPIGINIVENKPEFKRTFGFEIDLKLIKFSWSKTN